MSDLYGWNSWCWVRVGGTSLMVEGGDRGLPRGLLGDGDERMSDDMTGIFSAGKGGRGLLLVATDGNNGHRQVAGSLCVQKGASPGGVSEVGRRKGAPVAPGSSGAPPGMAAGEAGCGRSG